MENFIFAACCFSLLQRWGKDYGRTRARDKEKTKDFFPVACREHDYVKNFSIKKINFKDFFQLLASEASKILVFFCIFL